ncbi:hypothetical protein C1637_21060 [Chryseobacterium lactis]|uniref:Uncharacterized protein n=1 Tax=Chryseobacterium lactis TaxID=1241981 RepID=A0A3G6RFI9_CHRLC|nr:hypothetical protein [Chryseobacterium lactis]AZA83437.1 hypothetical protein EG342_16800 [Chryseobacterium lactis]AZB03821.1 hypothetical protein EG341_07675 [Chryseobacterium lactis]PNW11602.1 hypothetical protein C1637_21060 [Chryseobacterium lactis]
MEEFEIPVTYKGKDLLFNGRLATFSYGYKLYVDIDGNEVVFERDDEGNLRAIVPEISSNPAIEKELIESIIEVFNDL